MIDNTAIPQLAKENENMSDVDRLVNIYWALSHVILAGVPGAIAEIGCNAGRTSVFLQMIIQALAPGRELHLFDSFQGLPRPSDRDAYLAEGDCLVDVATLEATFERWEQPLPTVHEGWFETTLRTGLPPHVAFGYLDGDFYNSIMINLQEVWPRLPLGGLIMIDDYGDTHKNPAAWDGLPGVKAACDDFFADRVEEPVVLVGTGDLALASVRKVAW